MQVDKEGKWAFIKVEGWCSSRTHGQWREFGEPRQNDSWNKMEKSLPEQGVSEQKEERTEDKYFSGTYVGPLSHSG